MATESTTDSIEGKRRTFSATVSSVLPDALPTLLGPAFLLFDVCKFTPTADGTDESVAVVLSP